MLDLMQSLGSWRPVVSGQRCAVATIVAAGGSVPRPLGTSMIISEQGDVLGSLSGGCVEGAVVESAIEAMRDGGSRLEAFGYSAEDAFAVGLTCGGELEVHIQPLGFGLGSVGLGAGLSGFEARTGVALIRRLDALRSAVVVHDPATFRALESRELASMLDGDPSVLRAAAAQLEPLLHGGRAGLVRLAAPDGCAAALYEESGVGSTKQGSTVPRSPALSGSPANEPEPITLFVESKLPPARMLIFGANDFGAALLPAGRLLGYHVTLCDARPAFAGQDRFREADELVTDWPHRYLEAEAAAGRIDARTVVCVLTHDPKFDIPLLETALRLRVAYVGAMGSRRSHRQRIDALLADGTPAEALARLHSPIGLDLGAVTPAEVAVSITAEIVASRSRASLAPLKDGSGPIHSPAPQQTAQQTATEQPAPELPLQDQQLQEPPLWRPPNHAAPTLARIRTTSSPEEDPWT